MPSQKASRILFHDYGRYAFIRQLAVELARRGHQVLAVHSDAEPPRSPDHAPEELRANLEIRGIPPRKQGDHKASLVTRWKHEYHHGARLVELLDEFKPDVVLSTNTPLDAQKQFYAAAKKRNIRYVCWLQDVLSLAITQIITKKLGPVGRVVGSYYRGVESHVLRDCDYVVGISDAFIPILDGWNVPKHQQEIILNWACLDDVPLTPKDNDWAREHGLVDKKCALYAGNLGLKHEPELLLNLAKRLRAIEDARLVVIADGVAVEFLTKEKVARGLDNLVVLPFQPYERFPQVLGTADTLVACLSADAAMFSAPSKVLSYLCAGRPIVISAQEDNLAAEILVNNDAGLVTPPGDSDAFCDAVAKVLESPGEMGANARAFAEREFDIVKVADRFEKILVP